MSIFLFFIILLLLDLLKSIMSNIRQEFDIRKHIFKTLMILCVFYQRILLKRSFNWSINYQLRNKNGE
jgi:hypothetical protein